jgi:hypothetical protein
MIQYLICFSAFEQAAPLGDAVGFGLRETLLLDD